MARFLVVVVALLACCGAASAEVPYSIAPLVSPPEALDTMPTLISNTRTIVGFADIGVPSGQVPFLLSTSAAVALPASPGNTLFSPQAINNAGAIAGFLMPDAANPLPPTYSAALYQNGQYVQLAPPQLPPGMVTDDFRASGINNLGAVVGWVAEVGENNGHVRAVLWTNGQPSWIDPNADEASSAQAINDEGWIAGVTGPASGAYGRPVVWRDGTATYLPLPPGATSGGAIAINNAGQALVSYTGAGLGNQFLLWDSGAETLLPSAPASDGPTFADSMNAAGVVAGYSGGRAVVWQNGQIYDLNNLIAPNSGWLLLDATSINDAGDIAGYGTYGGTELPFLLTPTGDGFGLSSAPEPTALSLLALAALPLLHRRRRRHNAPAQTPTTR